MKIVFLLTIISIASITQSIKINKNIHEFMEGFLNSIYGKSYILEENCLTGTSEVNFTKLYYAITHLKFFDISKIVNDIATDFKNFCPVEILETIKKDFDESVDKGKYIVNTFKNFGQLIRILEDQYKTKDFSPKYLGSQFGRLMKIEIYGMLGFLS